MTPKPERTCFSWTLDSISRKVSIVFVLLGFVLDRRIWWIEHHVERRSTQQDVFATVKCTTVESLKWSLQMHNCTVENCISRLKLGIEFSRIWSWQYQPLKLSGLMKWNWHLADISCWRLAPPNSNREHIYWSIGCECANTLQKMCKLEGVLEDAIATKATSGRQIRVAPSSHFTLSQEIRQRPKLKKVPLHHCIDMLLSNVFLINFVF